MGIYYLENAVRINVMVSAAAASVLDILPAVVHPTLLLVAQDGVGFAHLQGHQGLEGTPTSLNFIS